MRDLRYAVRVLGRSPLFALTAIVTLALCIGANSAIYSVVDRVLLRPLPYPQPDRLAMVMTHFERALYQDPEQDLNTLWWDLVEEFQGVRRPEGRHAPDWASKISIRC